MLNEPLLADDGQDDARGVIFTDVEAIMRNSTHAIISARQAYI